MSNLLHRPRRLRRSATLRDMVRETSLSPSDFILPLFVVQGAAPDFCQPIGAMPGCLRQSPEQAVDTARQAWEAGVPAVLLFGIPRQKDAVGSGAWDPDGAVQVATALIKRELPQMLVIADTCMCEYTDHGHCGMLKDQDVDNDATLELLCRTAVSQARAGADLVAPSDMMDGRVGAIRAALDQAGMANVGIMAYSAKYASAFYGPFREAAESTPSFGDRKTYQMDPGNAREAMREMELDVAEGADILMVKPALAYLDIIRQARDRFDLPIAAYQVSGEYSMIQAAAEQGLIDGDRVMLETLTAIKRAGAKMIITYFAVRAAQML